MNKRGSVIGAGLLPAIAFLASIIALITFFSFSGGFEGKSNEYGEMMSEISFAEQYVLKSADRFVEDSVNCDSEIYAEICNKQIKERFMEIANMSDVKYSGAGNFFGRIRAGDFVFAEEREGYKLEIKEVFVIAKRGDNEVVRKFDVEKRYDKEGKILG